MLPHLCHRCAANNKNRFHGSEANPKMDTSLGEASFARGREFEPQEKTSEEAYLCWISLRREQENTDNRTGY